MSKPRNQKKPVPLARWAGQGNSRIRLVLPSPLAKALVDLLEQVAGTGNGPLGTAQQVARRQAQVLAAEQLARPALWHWNDEMRLTVAHSVALALLAWLLSYPATDDAAHPLRRLLDALHQLLS